jgi:hypothetical protein
LRAHFDDITVIASPFIPPDLLAGSMIPKSVSPDYLVKSREAGLDQR